MGSDDLFHKKRQRSQASLQRKKAKRKTYDYVLIVCEGEKTEPNYFKSIRDKFKLSSVNIEIFGEECGSSPISVVNFALRQYKKANREYDKIFCVIDRDSHSTYKQAVDKVRRSRLKKWS